MNILHHKSWHVYSQKNRDKVQEDEAKAGDAEKEKEKERIEKEREARLQQLRSRAQSRYGDSNSAALSTDIPVKTSLIKEHSYAIENKANKRKLVVEKDISESVYDGLTTASLLTSLKNNHQLAEPIPVREPSPIESHPLEAVDFHQEFLHHLNSVSLYTKEMLTYLLQKQNEAKPLPEARKVLKEKPAITNTFLVKDNESKPWYYKENFDQIPENKRFRDQKGKCFHDPLEDITRQLKRRSGPERPASPMKERNVSKTVDQLRAERVEREARERQRTQLLLSSSKFLDQEPMTSQSFHNQYNPYDTHQAKTSFNHHSPIKKHKSKKEKKKKSSKAKY
ncbi:hypothetical protein DSO57_1031487 [Entomophthora muscae]|uniref:Uncharacterized protein n=1 Tax=Entomophthora muscae TaxID=34485 RepID=A0ACC2SDI7_9FUNG|nr:hypothetical protein DSO57_1031487 [Entomophthora muscae]